MRPSWVAVTVRAKLLAGHAVGRRRALEIGACGSLDDAVQALAATAYGERLAAGSTLVRAQREVAETVLWQMRVLAGWAPAGGARRLRVLAAWFEIANIEQRLAELAGAPSIAPFELGRLAAVAPRRLSAAASPVAVAEALGSTEWGSPRDTATELIVPWLWLSWARRIRDQVPEAWGWALVALGLAVAAENAAGSATPFGGLPIPGAPGGRLDSGAKLGLADGDVLWPAEVAWWRRVEDDARRFLATGTGGPLTVTGAVAALVVDAHRVSAALASAARGAPPSMLEMLDAMV